MKSASHTVGRVVGVMSVLMGWAMAAAPPCHAGLTAVELGLSIPSISGYRGADYTTTLGWDGLVYIDSPVANHSLEVYGKVHFQPLTVRGLTGVKLNILDAAVGARTVATPAFWGLQPALGAQIGMAYAWEDFDTGAATTRNAKAYFSSAIVPGVDFGLFKGVMGSVQFPAWFIFNSPALTIWNATFSLRFKL